MMKVQILVNVYYQRLDYFFSIVTALQNSKRFSHLLLNKSLLKVCNNEATPVQSCCFNLLQWGGHCSGVFLCGFNFLSVEFGQNFDQLQSVVHKLFGYFTFIQKLAQNGHLRRLHSISCIVILFFLPVLSTFLLPVVFNSLAV